MQPFCAWLRAGWWWRCVLVGLLMTFVWRSLGVGMGVLGWSGVCLEVWVGGCMSEFWNTCIVYMLIVTTSKSTECLTQNGQKVEFSEFWKNTLHSSLWIPSHFHIRHYVIHPMICVPEWLFAKTFCKTRDMLIQKICHYLLIKAMYVINEIFQTWSICKE